jgi:hypothetical protein
MKHKEEIIFSKKSEIKIFNKFKKNLPFAYTVKSYLLELMEKNTHKIKR